MYWYYVTGLGGEDLSKVLRLNKIGFNFVPHTVTQGMQIVKNGLHSMRMVSNIISICYLFKIHMSTLACSKIDKLY